MKVIIAEDDKFLISAYRAKMVKSGLDVQIASDGSEVLDILKDFIPDVILLDLVMPKMDGFTTLEQIKSNPEYKDIPILVASNLGQTEDFEKAKALGADDYVVKSDLSLEKLIEKLTDLSKTKESTAV